jgi:LmbE family N-acetylglucosaminyl deacetylase
MPTVLALAAHPDDIEFLMAGTLLALRSKGWDIHYCNLANGCCGTSKYDRETITRIRRQEAIAAAKGLGAVYHESICNDLEIFYDRPTLLKVASIIRQARPSIVLTHAPVDYMEDHTNTCRLAVTAAFSRGMPNFDVDPPEPIYEGNVTVYHAQPYQHREPLGRLVEPGIVVNVTDLIEKKAELLAKHASQKDWLDESQGQDSYLQTMRDLDAELAKIGGGIFQYAEGWRRHRHVGFCGPDDDPLCAELKDRVIVASN